MQTAAVALRDHFEQEAENQRQALSDSIRSATLATMKEDVSAIEGTLHEKVDGICQNRVDQLYESTWRQELFQKMHDDVIAESVQTMIKTEASERDNFDLNLVCE